MIALVSKTNNAKKNIKKNYNIDFAGGKGVKK
jgi:hypothetical protein